MFAYCLAALAAVSLVVTPAAGQEYPAKPIVLLVPFAAGGPTAQADDRRRKCSRRRWHDRAGKAQGRTAGRLHDPPRAHWHVDCAGALPQPAVQTARGLRARRPSRRRADDAYRQERHAAERFARADRIPQGEQGQGFFRQCRRGLGFAPVRPVVHEHDPDRADHHSLQGHRSGDQRLAGWTGRHPV